MNLIKKFFYIFILSLISNFVYASIVVPMYLTAEGGRLGKKIGTVKLDNTIYGLLLRPKLKDLPPGIHGFHIHEMASCYHQGMSACGHLDPDKNEAHRGPYKNGHLGDLPVLIVDGKGKASLPILAPRLKLDYVKNKALMIHAGGDNYSDEPVKLGGGGDRIACGVIPYYS